MKHCNTCNQDKSETEFYYSCRTDDELQESCKNCFDFALPDACESVGRLWE